MDDRLLFLFAIVKNAESCMHASSLGSRLPSKNSHFNSYRFVLLSLQSSARSWKFSLLITALLQILEFSLTEKHFDLSAAKYSWWRQAERHSKKSSFGQVHHYFVSIDILSVICTKPNSQHCWMTSTATSMSSRSLSMCCLWIQFHSN